MATTKVVALTAGTRVVLPHPVTGAPVQRPVAKVTLHPVDGVTVYYSDGHAPTFHLPTDTVTTA